ncbi:phosphoribosyltransferase-like protein [Vreelandella titanicae]|uniref:PRTase-CE domain-containing protein n=1 Tax=Vreelandella titanicae TaxID=664683 RepID=A0A558J7Q6_9GAMM|nr:hypothetical protein [Halomonas titanicae]TVU89675.1 hypothetical protein FQP89_09980 [Halomonas titanicae]
MPHMEACSKISEIIQGYRHNEFGVYDISHVERWVAQFNVDEQETVILETLKILKQNYITLDSFTQLVNIVIDSNQIYRGEKDNYWQTVSLLDIQKNGSSQDELNDILVKTISERYSVRDIVGRESDEFIYLDDFIFSGNRLLADMHDWIANFAPNGCRVCIITIGWFTYGQWRTKNKLKEIAKEFGKNINFMFASYSNFRLENRLYRKDFSEILWPTESITNLDGYGDWLRDEAFDPKYRQVNGVDNKIFSSLRREKYERIMFKYGLKIMGLSSQNSSVVKPLGYSTFRGFGFGSMVFSFRNCPNNNPLVFWWGDPNANPSHPFSKWYPLLQRKTYG